MSKRSYFNVTLVVSRVYAESDSEALAIALYHLEHDSVSGRKFPLRLIVERVDEDAKKET